MTSDGYPLFVAPRIENGGSAALLDALAQAGVPHRPISEHGIEIGGRLYEVMPARVVRESDSALITHDLEDRRASPVVVVAERISAAARENLSRAGIAWLDRRGRLWIRADGMFVNTEVAPSTVPPTRVVEVLSGTGLDVAVALLISPAEPQGVNALARRIGRSPGRVSEILKALRSAGLVEAGNRPVIPELFWDVAERWRTRWTPLNTAPDPQPPERYRLSGTLGAVALDAPLAAGAGSWPQLYVGDEADATALTNAYGAPGWTAAEIAACPSRFGFSIMSGVERDGYPVASHLVVAFDLAQDRARGREVLEGWQPTEVTRVW